MRHSCDGARPPALQWQTLARSLARQTPSPLTDGSSERASEEPRPDATRIAVSAPARLRLTKRFVAIRRRGRWARGELLSVGALPNELAVTRLGLRIQRGMRGAVARNRTKRVFRAACRMHARQLSPGYDVLVVLHRIHDVSVAQCEDAWLLSARKLGLLTTKQIS